MVRKGDVQWWVLEARKYPESAPLAIEFLARRLAELDQQNEHLRDELLRLRQRGSSESDSGQVAALRRQIEKLEYLLKSQTATEPTCVLYSDGLRSARLPVTEMQRLARAGHKPLEPRALLSLRALLVARPHDEVLLVTSAGRGTKQLIPELPPLPENGRWPNEPSPWLHEGERLAAAAISNAPPRFWTIVTRKGYAQRFVRAAFEREMEQGDPLVRSLLDRDEAVSIVGGDRGDLVVLTRWGQANRFSHRAIEVQGSLAMDLEDGDEVVAALSLPEDGEIVIVTASGRATRRHTEQLPGRQKPGDTLGKRLIGAQDVLGLFPFDPQDHLLFLTSSGRLLLIPLEDLSRQDRLTKGVALRNLSRDPAIAVTVVPRDLR
jgi:DNA gyrase/topoisomerase IV subunit A